MTSTMTSSSAGLDTFAQRGPEIASRLRVFEVDQSGPQAWKRQRLTGVSMYLTKEALAPAPSSP